MEATGGCDICILGSGKIELGVEAQWWQNSVLSKAEALDPSLGPKHKMTEWMDA